MAAPAKSRMGISILAVGLLALSATAQTASQVRTDSGSVEGTASAEGKVRIFKGIPFAAPPVGDLRWKAPQPAPKWPGVKMTRDFGARCMQGKIYPDMVFRDNGPSEDCLYLNVWTPAKFAQAKLPVMVWIYGGGFAAGSASEARQDGEVLAKKGVVVVSFNYRLSIFGFFSLPELTKESGHNASGNYGMLDQVAALQWVQRNIAVFGGDPQNVTIFGESAGSFSVSGLMASPLARGLFKRAIGESGAFMRKDPGARPLAETEANHAKFADAIGATSLAALRDKPAADLLAEALKLNTARFWPNIDGYFFPEDPKAIYASGKQNHMPLLAGWNADEHDYADFFQKDEPTVKNYVTLAQAIFGENTKQFLELYPAATDDEAKRSAQSFASDQSIAYGTWKWIDLQTSAGNTTVYRYEFDDAPPQPAGKESRGAYHSAEIEFVFETLQSKNLPWRPDDEKLSELMTTYWTNFAKTGDPNGPGLPWWPAYSAATQREVMHLSFNSHAEPETHRARYEFLDAFLPSK